ncbi:uncharacterized protein K452DRAFT_194332, partial [Aplosporella prunicola CBS 121167]
FVADIHERQPGDVKPPSAPTRKATSTTGFPAHKKRTRPSAFKRQRDAAATTNTNVPTVPLPQPKPSTAPQHGESFDEVERRRIDAENNERLAAMSPEEIEQERQELFSGLNPALIERLLKRANLDHGSNETSFETSFPTTTDPPQKAETEDNETKPPKPKKTVAFAEPEEPSTEPSPTAPKDAPDADTPPSLADQLPPAPSVHWPRPPSLPDLDPSSPNFLADLHDKYFPELDADPSTLAWAAPLPTPNSTADRQSPYHPSLRALAASDLRFAFSGALIPPSAARDLPVTLGLHHHGEAPEAAGYTIPELALLARSKVPAQRCMAYQTLGRILFRLGRGEFGVEGTIEVEGPDAIEEGHAERVAAAAEGDAAELARGLWDCVEANRVVDTLSEEVNRINGHLTAKAFAEEALWNWRKGGGRRRKAV